MQREEKKKKTEKEKEKENENKAGNIHFPGRSLDTQDRSDSGKRFRQQLEIRHQKQANAISDCLCIGIMTQWSILSSRGRKSN